MHISEVNTSTHRSDHLRNAGVGGAEPTERGREAAEERPEKTSDRVEISDEARGAAESPEDLSFARNALHNVPELSKERTAQLSERIKSGYYNRPDVLRHLAERLGTDLTGGSQ